MMTYDVLANESSSTNLETKSYLGYGYLPASPRHHQPAQLRWGVFQPTNPIPVAYGQVHFSAFVNRISSLLKLERQHRERLAGVSLDPTAQKLLCALDRETSIRWEDLPEKAESVWSEASRSAALLVGANLCEVSPTRIRLNEYGDKLLAESSSADEANREVAS